VVVLALLYGQGDFGKALRIGQKCRCDSDASASTVGEIVGTP
jgi:hypothetical protein